MANNYKVFDELENIIQVVEIVNLIQPSIQNNYSVEEILTTDFILNEDGSTILNEDGGKLRQE